MRNILLHPKNNEQRSALSLRGEWWVVRVGVAEEFSAFAEFFKAFLLFFVESLVLAVGEGNDAADKQAEEEVVDVDQRKAPLQGAAPWPLR